MVAFSITEINTVDTLTVQSVFSQRDRGATSTAHLRVHKHNSLSRINVPPWRRGQGQKPSYNTYEEAIWSETYFLTKYVTLSPSYLTINNRSKPSMECCIALSSFCCFTPVALDQSTGTETFSVGLRFKFFFYKMATQLKNRPSASPYTDKESLTYMHQLHGDKK